MTTKRSVAIVIRSAERPGDILLVQRPDDDEDLPGVWGLPAASLSDDESHADAAVRAGRDKLGVVLEPGRVLNEGDRERRGYNLAMTLLEATISSGTPAAVAPPDGTTRYQAWRWGPPADLRQAAERGSLCSILALEVA